MNKFLAVLVSSAFASCAFAADPTPAKTPSPAQAAQQEKMATCNKNADGKKGDERKAFMKTCLSGGDGKVSAAQQAQRDKMKACNEDAATIKGDERKKFMKTCLSKK
jgi:hypothetical protein